MSDPINIQNGTHGYLEKLLERKSFQPAALIKGVKDFVPLGLHYHSQ